MRRIILFLSAIIWSNFLPAQKIKYSTANAHSHNNYAQPIIFWEACNLQYGSIEADVFLSADSNDLWVAHNREELAVTKRSLDSLYLKPLVSCIDKNRGFVYADHSLHLQLMIDVKSEAVPTLRQLIKMISKYPELMNNPSIKFVISGNRPDPEAFTNYPSFIWFDGEFEKKYTKENLEKIAMMSGPLNKYTRWNGEGALPAKDEEIIKKLIGEMHRLKKTVRFWAAPDNPHAWDILMQLQVDFINTDHVAELAQYFKTAAAKK